jgi:WD40 repeat protein
MQSVDKKGFPSTTCVRWKPSRSHDVVKPSTILSQTLSDGSIKHWNVVTNKLVHEITDHKENGSGINAADYTSDGKFFVAGG